MKSVAAFLILCTILLVQSHAEEDKPPSPPASDPPQFSGLDIPSPEFPPGKFGLPLPPPRGKLGLPPPPLNNDAIGKNLGQLELPLPSPTSAFTEDKAEKEAETKLEGDEENKTEDNVEESEVKEKEE